MCNNNGDNGGVNINKNVLREEFIFKDEIYSLLEEERDRCLRSILWTLEVIIPDKKSDDFIKLRKCVLDSVNDLYRKIYNATYDKVI